ncbi:MAG TPA: hypothetical protein VMT69_16250 [Kineosporiaceae bacterium]|nr:hypothetical protein [Kineosporiaceae bacterium]
MLHLVALAQPAAAPDAFVDGATHFVVVLAVVAFLAVLLARVSPDVVDVFLTVRSVVVAVVVVVAVAVTIFAVVEGVGSLTGFGR